MTSHSCQTPSRKHRPCCSVWRASPKMGLQLNAKKTEVMTFNINEKAKITTKNGTILAVKEDFKYLGSYISSTEKDIRVRKANAWRALHDLKHIWQSAMPDGLKRAIFMASVESILLYGSEAWTFTELAASNLVLWEPTQGQASRGGQSLTFIDQLLRDTSLKTAADIRTCMEDRDVWRVIVARGDSTR